MFYAVKPGKGRIPGLYSNETDAKKQIEGMEEIFYEFKEFTTVKEAMQYLNPKRKPYHELFKKSDYYIYTDGSCIAEKYSSYGPGGWSAVIIDKDDNEVEIAGGNPKTTSTEMELIALVRGLSYINLKDNETVQIFTDSNYVFDAIRNKKLFQWAASKFRYRLNKHQYADLWKEVYALLKGKKYQIHWVKGHYEIGKNNRCDRLARLGAKRFSIEKA